MLTWLYRNKEWVFSGIGVAILAAILGWFFSSSEPTSSVQAEGGVAAGGNIEGSQITITGPGDKTTPNGPAAGD